MRWPWKRQSVRDPLVLSWCGQTLVYVLARASDDGLHEVLKMGVERQGEDSMEAFVRRLQGLGLKGLEACVMLRPEQYPLLQIDAPAVPPEELRSAARYQIRDMIDSHVDDITLDVMRVGDGQLKGPGRLFVVAAPNTVVRSVLDLGAALQWTVPVIDIQETAQRNLQNALAARAGQAERANAALVLVPGQQAVLTISANGELFYTRRFDLPEGFFAISWGQGAEAAPGPAESFTPVGEYVPDYNVGGVSYGNDYTDTRAATPAATGGSASDDDLAQRFLVEVQRSLDVWDRSWSSMPLNGLRVYAGERSAALSQWLAVQMGQSVTPLDVGALFPGFEGGDAATQAQCLPLLGLLMRDGGRKL
jgi:MSHA biogenesis protein MshI